MNPCVFLDRDGTVIELVHHLTEPRDVKLLTGSGQAIRLLRKHGYRCVMVTNQSVIGRGMLDVRGLEKVHAELTRQLVLHRTELDGFYFCPYIPETKDPRFIEHPYRKPGPGMLQSAAKELNIDLAQSWMVGDSISDILAGRNAGCRGTILVRTGYGQYVDPTDEAIDYVVDDLLAAARQILSYKVVE